MSRRIHPRAGTIPDLHFRFAHAREVVTPQHRAGSQRVRAKYVGEKLHQRRANPLQLPGKLVDSRPLGRIGFVRQMGEAPSGERVIEGTKGRRKPLGFGLHKYLVRTRCLRIVRGQGAAQHLIDFRFRQPAEEIRKEGDLIALGDDQVDREPRPKQLGNRPKALLPVAAIALQALRIGGGTGKLLGIAKRNRSAEFHLWFGFAPKPPPEGNRGSSAQHT